MKKATHGVFGHVFGCDKNNQHLIIGADVLGYTTLYFIELYLRVRI